MSNPIKNLTKKEWTLWLCSLFVIIMSNMVSPEFNVLTLFAACIGVTSLIFAAKGAELFEATESIPILLFLLHLRNRSIPSLQPA
ncbi:MAG: hypothetical protein Q4B70_07795 [Lachnospiraceae bacterium]|nr:hypothetical protein [Lachnospiraceae bacterium]